MPLFTVTNEYKKLGVKHIHASLNDDHVNKLNNEGLTPESIAEIVKLELSSFLTRYAAGTLSTSEYQDY